MKRVNNTKKILAAVCTCALVLCASIPVLAADNVTVNGEIGIQSGGVPGVTNTTYSVTMPTSVNWYVTEHSFPAVWNTNTTANTANPNVIVNTNTVGAVYELSLDSFTGTNTDASAVASDLALTLTGDLAADGVGALNLSGGYAGVTNYTATMAAGSSNAWSYGFTGSYANSISTTALTPTYTMTIGFALN